MPTLQGSYLVALQQDYLALLASGHILAEERGF